MAATIKIKNSSTAGAAPTSSDLVQGELAVNVTDKRLYTENASGTVVELGTNPSVPVTFPDGSASAPSLTNDGDTNTGLFFPAADTIALTTGGSERLRLDSSGNFGIGSSSPLSTVGRCVQILNSGAAATIQLQDSTTGSAASDGLQIQTSGGLGYIWNLENAALSFGTNSTERMRIDASGNLGIGTTSPAQKLDVSGQALVTNLYLRSDDSDVSWGAGSGSRPLIRGNTTNNTLQFYTASTERARIDSSGNLLVGLTSGGDPYRFRASTNSGTTIWQFGPYSTVPGNYYVVNGAGTGVYITSGNTSWSTVSDERIKDIIEPISNALDKVSNLRTVIGKYKTDEEGTRRSFLIAQDVLAVFPEAVNSSNPDELAVQYTETIPLLVAAIKELKAEIDVLKGQA